MGLFKWLFNLDDAKECSDTKHSGWDEKDTKKWSKYQYGEEESDATVRRASHAARDDARNDPRSSDPRDPSYTGDWGKK